MKKAKSKKPAPKKKPVNKRLSTSESKSPHASVKPTVRIPIAGGKQVLVHTPKIRQNGYTRPAPMWLNGTPKITFRVWQIADELAAGLKRPPTRQEMLERCVAEGNDPVTGKPKITYALFSNHFYRWRKFNGLNGRLKKDGEQALTTGGPRPRKAGTNLAKEAAKPAIPAKPSPVEKKTEAKPAPASKPATKPPFSVTKKPPFPIPAVR